MMTKLRALLSTSLLFAVVTPVVLRSATGQVVNLGPQIFTANTHTIAFGHEGEADQIYLVRDGALDGGATPGTLIVLNPNTAEILRNIPLPHSEGSWGVTVATDQTVYIGVYATGHVFRYKPGAVNVTDLGQVPGQTFLYYLCAGANGAIHGGTFPGAGIFTYTPDNGFSLWSAATAGHSNATYVRGTAYDPVNHVVYGSLGTPARLIRWNPVTNESRDITTAAFAHEAFILGIRVVGRKVFCKLADQSTCVVLDVSPDGKTVTEDAAFPMMSIYVSPADEGGRVYYTDKGVIYSYNPVDKFSLTTGQRWPSNAYELGLLKLSDQTNFPGTTLVAIGNSNGQIWLGKHNLTTGHTTVDYLSISGIKQTIESIFCGPDGKIYSSGYLTGGTSIHDPSQPELSQPTLRGVTQCEGITSLDGKIYYGGYPQAILYEHDPLQSWNPPSNPRQLFKLADHEQDRPFGMSSGGGFVIMGTAPNYGHLGGALCLYDPSSKTQRIRSATALGVTDLSINTTCYHEGIIYGGTSISGGLGATPLKSRALLLRYDIASDAGIGIPLPESIPNQSAITAVCVGPEGNIWMMCEGWLLIYDPQKETFVHQTNLFPSVQYQPTASRALLRDATLLLGRDGKIYGTIRNRYLFRINTTDYALEQLVDNPGGCTGLVQHPDGDFYFFANTDLMRFTP